LCVALSKTDTNNLQASSTIIDYQIALKGLLNKARSVCAGDILNLPLLGSGLSRTGIQLNILIDLILLAIFDENKSNEITKTINIVLPKNIKNEVNLSTIEEDWR